MPLNLAPLFQSFGEAGSQYGKAKLDAADYRLKQLMGELDMLIGRTQLSQMQEELRRRKAEPEAMSEADKMRTKWETVRQYAEEHGIKLNPEDFRSILQLPELPVNRVQVKAALDKLTASAPKEYQQLMESFGQELDALPAGSDPLPILTRAQTILGQGIGREQTGSRLVKGDLIPDKNSITGYSRQMMDRQGNVVKTIPNVFVPQLMGTVQEGWQITQDEDGNIIAIPKTTVTHKVGPGASGGAGGPKISPEKGVTIGRKLTNQERNALGVVNQALPMMDKVISELAPHKSEGSILDSATVRTNWFLYNQGLNPPSSWLTPYFQYAALVRVLNTQQYLRGIRNMKFVEQIQQHMPNPEKDVPSLAYEKAIRMKQLMLEMRTQFMGEDKSQSAVPDSGAPPPGARVRDYTQVQ